MTAGTPWTVSFQPLTPRRATVAVSSIAASKASATSLRRAAAIRSARLFSIGRDVLLVASQHDDDRTVGQGVAIVQRLERGEDDEVAPLHVEVPGPSARTRSRVGFPSSTVSRWPINNNRLPRVPLRSAIRCPARCISAGIFDPARREAKFVKLGPKQRADLLHPGQVQRGAPDVDRPLQDRDRLRRAPLGASCTFRSSADKPSARPTDPIGKTPNAPIKTRASVRTAARTLVSHRVMAASRSERPLGTTTTGIPSAGIVPR